MLKLAAAGFPNTSGSTIAAEAVEDGQSATTKIYYFFLYFPHLSFIFFANVAPRLVASLSNPAVAGSCLGTQLGERQHHPTQTKSNSSKRNSNSSNSNSNSSNNRSTTQPKLKVTVVRETVIVVTAITIEAPPNPN